MSNYLSQAIHKAVFKLLRPLVKLLLQHGIPFKTFSEIAQHVYIDVATKDFEIPGKKQSLSRVSVLTGINRKEIAKLENKPSPLNDENPKEYNRSARIVSGWIRDVRFHDENGQAGNLPIDGDIYSFSGLVRCYGGDVTVRAALDELLRVGSIKKNDDLTVSLCTRAYIPQSDIEEKLRIMGSSAADLFGTMNHNLELDQSDPRAQRTVAYSNIPVECLGQINARSKEEIQAFLVQANGWLSQYDRDVNDKLVGSGQARAGIGVYYFQEDLDTQNNVDPENTP